MLERIIRETPKDSLERATVRAMRKTLTWLRFETAKDLSGELAVKLPIIRQRFRTTLRRGAGTEGELAVIADAIPAIILGVGKTPHGVKTGEHVWDQGFVAEWHKLKNPKRVWQRLTKGRLPIAQAKIPMAKSAEGVMEAYASRAQRRFLTHLERELAWEFRRWMRD